MPKKGSKTLIRHAQGLHNKFTSLLVEQTSLTPDDVHQLRVAVKELRALWQVLKPFLADGLADTASRDIAKVAALLAGARDQHVQIKTLDKRIRSADAEDLPALRAVRARLIAQQTESTEQVLMTADIVSRFAQDLDRWQGLEIVCARRNLIRHGYGRLYRKAYKRFRQAAASGKAEDWHRLRRWIKFLSLALPLVADDDEAMAAAKSYADLAARLGDLHDLHVMTASLRALPDQDDPLIRQSIASVERQADSQQSLCHRKSGRLFGDGHARSAKP